MLWSSSLLVADEEGSEVPYHVVTLPWVTPERSALVDLRFYLSGEVSDLVEPDIPWGIQTETGIIRAIDCVGMNNWPTSTGHFLVARLAGDKQASNLPVLIGQIDDSGWVWAREVKEQKLSRLCFMQKQVGEVTFGLFLHLGLKTEARSPNRMGNWVIEPVAPMLPCDFTQVELTHLDSWDAIASLGMEACQRVDIFSVLSADWWNWASNYYTGGRSVAWSAVVRSMMGWMGSETQFEAVLMEEDLGAVAALSPRMVRQTVTPFLWWADHVTLPDLSPYLSEVHSTDMLDEWGMGRESSGLDALMAAKADWVGLDSFMPFGQQRIDGVYLQYFWGQNTNFYPVWIDWEGRQIPSSKDLVEIEIGQSSISKTSNTLPEMEWVEYMP